MHPLAISSHFCLIQIYLQGMGRPTLRQLHSTTSHGELKVGCHAAAYLSEITCCQPRPTMTPAFTTWHAHSSTLPRFLPPLFFLILSSPCLPPSPHLSRLFPRAAFSAWLQQERYFALESSRMSRVLPAFSLAES